MSRLGGVSGAAMMALAERRGWFRARIRGDHFIYRHPESPIALTIPAHRELRPGLTRSLIRAMGMTVDEFLLEVKK